MKTATLASMILFVALRYGAWGAEAGDSAAPKADSVFAKTTDHSTTAVRATLHGGDSGGVEILKETKDTVYIVDKPRVEQAPCSWRGHIDNLRKRGWGGSGGPLAGVMAIYSRPLRDLISNEASLAGYSFVMNQYFEPFVMNGGVGYGGVGSGVRLGGGGMSGSRTFQSAIHNDSVVELETSVAMGGFMIEKAFVNDRMNFMTGGFLGGGSIKVKRSATYYTLNSVFSSGDHLDAPEHEEANARFTYLELHSGFTYSFGTFVHGGLNLSLPFFLSPEGFGNKSGDFYTVNPCISARVMFGILG
jgi:hypothetical protein